MTNAVVNTIDLFDHRKHFTVECSVGAKEF